jgi:hypothetical protein
MSRADRVCILPAQFKPISLADQSWPIADSDRSVPVIHLATVRKPMDHRASSGMLQEGRGAMELFHFVVLIHRSAAAGART